LQYQTGNSGWNMANGTKSSFDSVSALDDSSSVMYD
jgi:hypothetical protein